MPLAGNDDDVASVGLPDRQGDGRAAVEFDHDLAARAEALENLLGDGLGPLASRVISRDDDAIGEPLGDLGHGRPLGAVSVAPAAENDDQPRPIPHEVRHGRERMAQGVGLVSIVHEDRERFVGRDGFEPPAHRARGFDAGGNRLQGDRQRLGDRRRGQAVQNIVRAQERREGLHAAARRHQHEAGPREARPDVLGGHVGAVPQAVPQVAGAGAAGKENARRIVPVEDRPCLRVEALEQEALGLTVLLHRGVVIHVLGTEVRERRHGEVDAGGPALVEGVARDLHDGRLQAAVHHLGKVGRQIVGVGRGHVGRNLARPDPIGDRTEEPRRPARAIQDAPDEVRGRRLATGSRYTADREAPGRVARERVSRQAQGFPRIADHEERRVGGQAGGSFDRGRDGPRMEGHLDELVAVGLRAGNRHEEVPGPDTPRVVDRARHLDLAWPCQAGSGNTFGEFAQLHGQTPQPGFAPA